MNIIIAVILVVACTVSRSTRQESRPVTAVITIEPSAPIDAASDGAATPPMIDPSTAPTSATGGATTRNIFRASSDPDTSARSSLGMAGTIFGRRTPSPRM